MYLRILRDTLPTSSWPRKGTSPCMIVFLSHRGSLLAPWASSHGCSFSRRALPTASRYHESLTMACACAPVHVASPPRKADLFEIGLSVIIGLHRASCDFLVGLVSFSMDSASPDLESGMLGRLILGLAVMCFVLCDSVSRASEWIFQVPDRAALQIFGYVEFFMIILQSVDSDETIVFLGDLCHSEALRPCRRSGAHLPVFKKCDCWSRRNSSGREETIEWGQEKYVTGEEKRAHPVFADTM